MKTAVKKIDGSTRELTIEVPAETVKNKFTDVFGRLSKEAKVKGFRQGNVPRDILEKNFSGHAQEMVIKELIPEAYDQALEKENIAAIELPEVSDVKLENGLLTFKAKVEIAPEIKLNNYKGIKILYKNTEVTADEVKRSLDSLKESRKLENLDDSVARSLGYPALRDLEKTFEAQLYLQKDNQRRQKAETTVVDALNKDLNFKIPQSIVNRQLGDLVRQTKMDLALKGIPTEEIKKEESTLREKLEPQAVQQVKVYLVFQEVAKKENIPLDEHMTRKVMEFLLREAKWEQEA